jgi:hypothetical protein
LFLVVGGSWAIERSVMAHWSEIGISGWIASYDFRGD